jgi:hypothetical protein
MHRLAVIGVTATAALSVLTGVAGASTFTVGSATAPASGTATADACTAAGLATQTANQSGTVFALPAGGQITQWQTNTSGASTNAAGEAANLAALAPLPGGAFRVDAVDHETLPNPLPPSGVATFIPATPMMVPSGDVLGISGGADTTCAWIGGASLSVTGDLFAADPVAVGDAFSPLATSGLIVTVAATVVSAEDSAVTTAVKPAAPLAGGAALLVSTVTDKGPAGNPLTFTDTIPSGLSIQSAVSSGGPCTIDQQVVTCTIPGLTSGQSAPVDVVVTGRAGTYTNQVAVTQPSAATDPVTTNNKATAAFAVAPATVTKCVVTSLANLPLGTAKKLLSLLNCKAGKVSKSSSSKVAKGNVIKTNPSKGSFAPGKSIAIVESSGPKPKKHAKKKKK